MHAVLLCVVILTPFQISAQAPTLSTATREKVFVVAEKADTLFWKPLYDQGVKIWSKDLVLQALIKQELDFSAKYLRQEMVTCKS